ncbi:unnamed protein product [Linum tenue]|uniref:RNase H type-1 domain-containing protein n=1 Tax=Linum tenue TaxID=586396 RepID=A0AAV0MSS3_9ROSI|nr:unnamed protein product [Linum tenue]
MEVEISWKPPPLEWVTLNSDSPVIPESDHATAGGLIRDHTGCCLAAFASNLEICSITRAELRGAVEGLQLAWERGYCRVRVELDFQCVVQLLHSQSTDHHHAVVIERFQELCTRDWEVLCYHIYREGNTCTDFLASRGHSLPLGTHLVPMFDPGLSHFIMYDCQGFSVPRLVVNES